MEVNKSINRQDEDRSSEDSNYVELLVSSIRMSFLTSVDSSFLMRSSFVRGLYIDSTAKNVYRTNLFLCDVVNTLRRHF